MNQTPLQNNPNRNAQNLFTQKTPEVRKKQFFKITVTIVVIVVLILLYKSFASTGVGTAGNISLNYDTNTIKQQEGKIECIEDDRILQWHEGLEMWECKKPTSAVFGELDKNNVRVNDSGELECKEDGKALIWDDDQWACGDAGGNITTENGLEIDSNDALSIDSPTCSSAEKLIWDGNDFQCEEDQNEDEQTLSLTDNVLSILNGNDIDLTNLDSSEDLEDHIDDNDIHFTEGSVDHNNITNTHNLTTDIDHGNITGLTDDDHTQYALLDGRSKWRSNFNRWHRRK